MLHTIGIASNAITRILQEGTNVTDAKVKRHPHANLTTTPSKHHPN